MTCFDTLIAKLINPIPTRQNFLINGPGGIDSTQHIQTLITPELQKIKNPFLLHEKLNFLTNSPNQRWKPVGSTGWSGCRSGRDSSTGRLGRLKYRSNSPFLHLKDIKTPIEI